MGVTEFAIKVEGKPCTGLDRGLAIGKLSDTNFRPLEVDQDPHVNTESVRCRTNNRCALAMVIGRAMREIKTHNIDPRSN